jgi:hypothetical protein
MSQLPTIQLFDELYYVDRRLRQLRNTTDPHDFIEFDDFETSLKLAAISIRQDGGEEKHRDLWQRLMQQARDYDAAVGNSPSRTLNEPDTSQTPLSTTRRNRRLSMT